MDKDNYFSSAIVTFPSEGDYKLWSDKFELFNTDKSKEFLRKSGQLNVSCIRIADETLVKILIIWEYEDEEVCSMSETFQSGEYCSRICFQNSFQRGKKFYSW